MRLFARTKPSTTNNGALSANKGADGVGNAWKPLKTDDPVIRSVVTWLRGLVSEAGLGVRDLAPRCGCKPTTVSKRLSGVEMPPLAFVDRLIEACSPPPQWPSRKKHVRSLMTQPRPAVSRAPVVIDAYSRVVESQQETITAQRQLIGVSDELNQARRQLLESTRVELRAAQMISVLRIVLLRLAGVVSELADERALAEASLSRARTERDRATALADAALELITSLGERIGGVETPVEVPVITSDDVLLDMTAGLRRVQQILDDQDETLDRLESESSPVTMADQLIVPYLAEPTPVAILDEEGWFLRVNDRFLIELGYRSDQLRHLRLDEIAHRWEKPDRYWLLSAEPRLLWRKVRRWPVLGCQTVVVEPDAEAERQELAEGTTLPSALWLKQWLGRFKRGTRIGVCRIFTFSRLDAEFYTAAFSLLQRNVVVAHDQDGYFTFVWPKPDGDMAAFVTEMTTIAGRGGGGWFSEVEAAVHVLRSDSDMARDLETSRLWRRAVGDGKFIVRELGFTGALPDDSAPELYHPLYDTRAGVLAGVQVAGPITRDLIENAVERLRGWNLPTMTFLVSSQDLRACDWGRNLPPREGLPSIRLMLVGDLTFEDYVVLRKFESRFEVGVASKKQYVLDRARRLGLVVPDPGVVTRRPTDAEGITALLS